MRKNARRGFSLVELLVVMAIIGILVSLLIPVILSTKTKSKIYQARQEIGELRTAVGEYVATYGRMPVTPAAQNPTVGQRPMTPADFTFGTVSGNGPGLLTGGNGQSLPSIRNSKDDIYGGLIYYDYQANNSEVMAILMAAPSYLAPGDPPTVNTNNWLNPRRKTFLNPKRVLGNRSSGVGEDLVYRDPWGNPYMITLDLRGSGSTSDAFYRMAHLSERVGPDQNGPLGQVGVVRSVSSDTSFQYPPTAHYGDRHIFVIRDQAAIWSFGPDGQADINWNNAVEQKAENGVNKDNILSWRIP